MSILNTYETHFLPTYSNYPQGKYITLMLARRVESEAIFRTEGSGEPLNKEFVHAGSAQKKIIERVVISKRKQTAVERRTGRELLRAEALLFEKDAKSGQCALNRNNPCEQCLDCMIYGYAAGGGGAQKSRVVTDDAFSLHPASLVLGQKQFNALFDNSTMRDPETGKPSSSIGMDEYVKPETIFLDMETVRDVTVDEFRYVLGNILRSNRYGAVSSRIGKVKNVLVGLTFSNCELFSNLELTQHVYQTLHQGEQAPDFPLPMAQIIEAMQNSITTLSQQVVGQVTPFSPTEVTTLVTEMTDFYGDANAVRQALQTATDMYPKK